MKMDGMDILDRIFEEEQERLPRPIWFGKKKQQEQKLLDIFDNFGNATGCARAERTIRGGLCIQFYDKQERPTQKLRIVRRNWRQIVIECSDEKGDVRCSCYVDKRVLSRLLDPELPE